MNALRRAAGLIAALLVAGSGGLLVAGAPAIGGLLLLVGGGLAAWQGWRLWQSRRDPYDLGRLQEREPDPPEEADEDAIVDPDGTTYCHHCGHAVPPPLRVCPECGRSLGG
jgi:hypothetical protein